MNRDRDRSGEAGQTAKQAGPKARARAAESGSAQPQPTNPKTPNTHIGRIVEALAEYDARMADCPVSNPKRGQVLRPFDQCPRCKARADGSCGISSGAGYQLAQSVRTYLESMEGGR